ncbi:uncharacterized protein ARMOST_20497 [Armillaria ostoyae]|uniref:Uncharacterized protein n=1 Tax=Armillaria ostoyae TaxID=47428 RepID=A0A284S7I1_ARMOS|nr:uncharacterized protein ARMOST_20497 [Armillaria ostoyae]
MFVPVSTWTSVRRNIQPTCAKSSHLSSGSITNHKSVARIPRARTILEDVTKFASRTRKLSSTQFVAFRAISYVNYLRNASTGSRSSTEKVGNSLYILTRTQWVLSYVSCRLRRVALNTTSLLNAIDLFFGMYRTCHQMKSQYMLMLERSRGHDIVVAIYSEEDISSLGGLAVVVAGISWCTELALFISYATLPAFSMCRGSLTQLRHLFLKFTDDIPPDVPALPATLKPECVT